MSAAAQGEGAHSFVRPSRPVAGGYGSWACPLVLHLAASPPDLCHMPSCRTTQHPTQPHVVPYHAASHSTSYRAVPHSIPHNLMSCHAASHPTSCRAVPCSIPPNLMPCRIMQHPTLPHAVPYHAASHPTSCRAVLAPLLLQRRCSTSFCVSLGHLTGIATASAFKGPCPSPASPAPQVRHLQLHLLTCPDWHGSYCQTGPWPQLLHVAHLTFSWQQL